MPGCVRLPQMIHYSVPLAIPLFLECHSENFQPSLIPSPLIKARISKGAFLRMQKTPQFEKSASLYMRCVLLQRRISSIISNQKARASKKTWNTSSFWALGNQKNHCATPSIYKKLFHHDPLVQPKCPHSSWAHGHFIVEINCSCASGTHWHTPDKLAHCLMLVLVSNQIWCCTEIVQKFRNSYCCLHITFSIKQRKPRGKKTWFVILLCILRWLTTDIVSLWFNLQYV